MYFKYSWEKGVQFAPIAKNLDINCVSALPVSFSIKVSSPFSISKEHLSLLPGKTETIKIDFDPSQKIDRQSGE